MSEAEKKNTESNDASASSEKDGDSKRLFGKTYSRNKYQNDYRSDRRYNDNYSRGYGSDKRNRGSYRGGYRNDNFGRKPYKRNWSNSEHDGKRKRLEVGNRLKDCDVGITEFIGDGGFFGVIKERYTDFHVNEIALDGQIAKLTNQDVPKIEEDDVEELRKIVSDTIWNQLQTLNETDPSPVEIDVTDLDKEQRRAIHAIAKKITNVVSQTIDRDDKKIVVIVRNSKSDNRNNYNFRRDTRVDWTKRGGEYCHFLLHKVNMDTMDTLNQLAINLRVKPNSFSYAGTKDRRAWTTQWVSLRKVDPLDILRGAKNVRGAYVGNFKFATEPLKLGMLDGNHFRIALRNVTGTDEQVEKAMISIRDRGFINYYGLQRFGTVPAIPTYAIGKALLQGNWEQAIELILKPRDGEQDRDLAEARKIYETTKDAYTAYLKIKRFDKIEATLLKGIHAAGAGNPQGALDSLPRNVRLMYIHAYQSFVWNHMVSRRIKEFGPKPIVGDLVYEHSAKVDSEIDYDSVNQPANDDGNRRSVDGDLEPELKISKLETAVEPADVETKEGGESSEESTSSIKQVTDATEACLKINETGENENASGEKDTDEAVNDLPAVRNLKEEDLANYTLADIIMPQVGWKVTYPTYAKPWFEEFLAKDGLTTDLRQKNKRYSLGGTYRKMLQVPTNLSWKIVRYKEKHSDLLICDIHEMRKLSPPKDEPEGQYKALIVEISLKSSTYATMALREILKCDTCPQTQAAQAAACTAETEAAADEKTVTEPESSTSVPIDSKTDEKESEMESEAVAN